MKKETSRLREQATCPRSHGMLLAEPGFNARSGSHKHALRFLPERLREKPAALRFCSVLTVKKEPDIKDFIKQAILDLFPLLHTSHPEGPQENDVDTPGFTSKLYPHA